MTGNRGFATSGVRARALTLRAPSSAEVAVVLGVMATMLAFAIPSILHAGFRPGNDDNIVVLACAVPGMLLSAASTLRTRTLTVAATLALVINGFWVIYMGLLPLVS